MNRLTLAAQLIPAVLAFLLLKTHQRCDLRKCVVRQIFLSPGSESVKFEG